MKLVISIYIIIIKLFTVSANNNLENGNISVSNIPLERDNAKTTKHKKNNFPYFDITTIYVLNKNITTFSENIQSYRNKYDTNFFSDLFYSINLDKKYQILFNHVYDIQIILSDMKNIEIFKVKKNDGINSDFDKLFSYTTNYKISGIFRNSNMIVIESLENQLILKKQIKNYSNIDFEYNFKLLDEEVIEKYIEIFFGKINSLSQDEKNKKIIDFSKYLINYKKIFVNFDYDDKTYLLDFNVISKELIEKYNEIIKTGLELININVLNPEDIIIFNFLGVQIVTNNDNRIDNKELNNLTQLININLKEFSKLLEKYRNKSIDNEKNESFFKNLNDLLTKIEEVIANNKILVKRTKLLICYHKSVGIDVDKCRTALKSSSYIRIDTDDKIINEINMRIHIIMLTGIIIKYFIEDDEIDFINYMFQTTKDIEYTDENKQKIEKGIKDKLKFYKNKNLKFPFKFKNNTANKFKQFEIKNWFNKNIEYTGEQIKESKFKLMLEIMLLITKMGIFKTHNYIRKDLKKYKSCFCEMIIQLYQINFYNKLDQHYAHIVNQRKDQLTTSQLNVTEC